MKVMVSAWLMSTYIFSLGCTDGSFAGKHKSTKLSSSSGDATPGNSTSERLLDIGVSDATTLADACAPGSEQEIKKKELAINFPSRKDCRWNEGGNLDRLDQFLQARETSSASLELPANSVVCSMQLNSVADTEMHYDDFLFLALENNIIFGSNKRVTARLPLVDRTYRWDFESLVGSRIGDFESPYYCLPGSDACEIPGHDSVGSLTIDISAESLAPVSLPNAGKENLEMSLIATGDNDDEDCMHTGLNLNIHLEYIQL